MSDCHCNKNQQGANQQLFAAGSCHHFHNSSRFRRVLTVSGMLPGLCVPAAAAHHEETSISRQIPQGRTINAATVLKTLKGLMWHDYCSLELLASAGA